jgi:hypothetical protein
MTICPFEEQRNMATIPELVATIRADIADYDRGHSIGSSLFIPCEDARLLLDWNDDLAKALKPLAALPIGTEIEEDRDLVLYKNAGRAITVGDVLEARSALARLTEAKD